MSSPSAEAHNGFHVPVSQASGYVAVELPYAGDKMSALVLMPTGTTLPAFLASLTPASLAQIVSGMSPQSVQLSMPSFTERSDYNLIQTLSSMGMAQAFGPEADLTGIALRPPLYVQAVEQHAYLQVTPKGTTAAAATGVGVAMSATEATPHPIVIDHPFLFLVRDNVRRRRFRVDGREPRLLSPYRPGVTGAIGTSMRPRSESPRLAQQSQQWRHQLAVRDYNART